MSVMVFWVIFLLGCQDIKMWFKDFEESFKGLEMVIQTYDEQSQLIDQITGKSILIERDSTFDTDAEAKDSSVIQITIGTKEMHHVGSSMIIAAKGLENIFDDDAQTVDAQTIQRGLPVINSFVGKEKVVLIRTQNGTPLATYGGNNVSLYKTDVPKSTGLLIDGQYVFVYRCDYTIYDLALLE